MFVSDGARFPRGSRRVSGYDAVRVIVLGSLQIPLLPVYNEAVDGFYKRADGTVGAIPDEEFREFE